MKGFVVTVDFKLKPGRMAEFRELIDENARASCRLEPGCRRFDVLIPKQLNDRLFLYEIYDDLAGFQEHLKTPHFAKFNAASELLVESKEIRQLDLVCEGSEQ